MVHYLNVMEELRNGGGGHNINGDDGDEESEDKHSKKLEEARDMLMLCERIMPVRAN